MTPDVAGALAEARRLLATTPFAAGFRVRLDSRRVMQDLAGPVARGLSELGLTADENLIEDEAFFGMAERRGGDIVVAPGPEASECRDPGIKRRRHH